MGLLYHPSLNIIDLSLVYLIDDDKEGLIFKEIYLIIYKGR